MLEFSSSTASQSCQYSCIDSSFKDIAGNVVSDTNIYCFQKPSMILSEISSGFWSDGWTKF